MEAGRIESFLSAKLKLKGCPANNQPGTDIPAHRWQILIPSKPGSFSIQEKIQTWGSAMNFPTPPSWLRARYKLALGWFSCHPDPGSFPETQAAAIKSFKT